MRTGVDGGVGDWVDAGVVVKEVPVRSRLLLVPVLLAATGGTATTQTAIPATTTLTVREEQSIDRVLERLEHLRALKAEVERQERELVKAFRQTGETPTGRLWRLGINPVAPPVEGGPMAQIDRLQHLGVRVALEPDSLPASPGMISFYVGLFDGN